jgi:hypothetical protein
VTAVVDASPEAVERAFGAEPFDPDAEPGEDGSWAWFVHRPGGTIVIEDNGVEGIRGEVLSQATRGKGKAASIFWNVNGLVEFACSRRGKAAGSTSLEDPDESDLEAIPRALRRLAATCAYDESFDGADDVDRIAVGAAMVETFTGVSFGPDDITSGEPRRLTPLPSTLEGAGTFTLSDDPDLRAHVEALAEADQRLFAAWVARAAVAESGMEQEPSVAAMLDQLADPLTVPSPVPGLDTLSARQSRAYEARWTAAFDDEDLHFDLEGVFERQRGSTVRVVRQLAHPDPAVAALTCAHWATHVFAASTLDRLDIYEKRDTGRWHIGQESNPRRQVFVEVLDRVAQAPPSEWEAMRNELPTPLTAEEKADAVRRDQVRRDRGDFATYQLLPSAKPNGFVSGEQGQSADDGEDGLFLRSLTAEEADELRNRWDD